MTPRSVIRVATIRAYLRETKTALGHDKSTSARQYEVVQVEGGHYTESQKSTSLLEQAKRLQHLESMNKSVERSIRR